jgi:DNA-binding transcriptional MocR family regulator
MVSEHTRSVAARARRVYDERLRATLEALHSGRYVAVEPESGDYFLADTLDSAADAAQAAHPARQSHVLRVGHAATLHIGGAWS